MDPVVVATDSDEVAAVCRERGIPVVMTSPDCASGSDRVREVARQIDADIYVNIQGDEPTLTPEFFPPLLELFERPEVEVATLAVRCPAVDIDNPECGEGGDGAGWEGAVFFAGDDSVDRDQAGFAGYRKHLGNLCVPQGCAGDDLRSLPPGWLENGGKAGAVAVA